MERQARAARLVRRDAVAAWWTIARWFTARPHPVLLLILADLPRSVLPDSLARTADVQQWLASYSLTAAAREKEHAHRAEAEADSLRAQQRSRRPARRPSPPTHAAAAAARLGLEMS